jgi:beta-RFAP synthase
LVTPVEPTAMPVRRVEVSAPARLHFGMLAAGGGGRRYGGAGAMIDRPRLRLAIERTDALCSRAELPAGAERAREFAERAAGYWSMPDVPLRIEVHEAPPQHIGLGSGTQMGMAVAAALARLVGRDSVTAEELARSVGRGARSAVGVHGFGQGGLLVEGGKQDADELSPLIARIPLPEAWRFVLLQPRGSQGLSGAEERRAFERLAALAPAAEPVAEATRELARHAASASFDAFCECLFQHNRLAGEAFAAVQGGLFAHQAWIDRLRAWGIRGVGQSSWGPTVFAVIAGDREAAGLVARLAAYRSELDAEPSVARPDNRGAVVTWR